MTRLSVEIPDIEYMQFKQIVGEGNLSQIIRNFILSYNSKINLEKAEVQKNLSKAKAEFDKWQSKLDALNFQEEQEMEKKKKFMEEQKMRLQEAENRTLKTHLSEMV